MQTQAQVRVQDPILTSHAHGYRHMDRVGNYLFPPVTVTARGGKVLKFGKESFKKYNARRTPGTAKRRIDVGYEAESFALVQDSLESPLPIEHKEDAAVTPGIDLGLIRVNRLMDSLSLLLEIQQAEIAQSNTNYDSDHKVSLGSGEYFDDPDVIVPQEVDGYKEAIRTTIGAYPNVIIAGPKAHVAVKNAPSVVERFKYTSADVITEEMLAQLFGVQRYLVGKGTYVNDSDAFVDIWGNKMILAYVPPEVLGTTVTYAPGTTLSFETPSYGYTYTLNGNPVVKEPYWEEQSESWIYGCSYERIPVLTSMAAGFLVENVATPA